VNPGGAIISLNNVGAVTPGSTYTLMTFNSATSPANISLDPGTAKFGFNTAALNVTSTSISVTIAGPPVPSAAYWSGAYGGNWNAAGGLNSNQSNFNTAASAGDNTLQLPGPTTDVLFATSSPSPVNLATHLGQNFIIKSLTLKAGTGTCHH